MFEQAADVGAELFGAAVLVLRVLVAEEGAEVVLARGTQAGVADGVEDGVSGMVALD